jgi:hypothetical protein
MSPAQFKFLKELSADGVVFNRIDFNEYGRAMVVRCTDKENNRLIYRVTEMGRITSISQNLPN